MKKFECKKCSNKCVIECSDDYFPIMCVLNDLTNSDWVEAEWNMMNQK